MSCKIPFFVENYFKFQDEHPEEICKEQWALRRLIEKSFQEDDIFVDVEQAEKYFSLVKYFPYDRLYEWEEFFLGLHLCVYWKDTHMPRWTEAFCMLGRGAGKDGIISVEGMALVSPYNPIQKYDVDICANNEEQATRPLNDVVELLEEPEQKTKLEKFFYHTKELVKGKKNKGRIKGHTNNPKGRDGLRSGCVILNEVHQYENVKNVNVFTTGLGKVEQPRKTIYTTDGDVVEGYLDDLKKKAQKVLFEGAPDNGFLPFICKIDEEKEINDEIAWRKANPSLRYKPSLLLEMRIEYADWVADPAKHTSFPTKRMNFRKLANETCVAEWADILKTNQEIPNLIGSECALGIDCAKTNDWIGLNVHFKQGDMRYDINHAWLCTQSDDYPRYKDRIPIDDWVSRGLLTIVNEKEIHPSIVTKYIVENVQSNYIIKKICLDSFRYALWKRYLLDDLGIDEKDIHLTRPSDLIKCYIIINHCFVNGYFCWGDNPMLRWATNNTKAVPVKKSKLTVSGENDMGNFTFGKIEPHVRKTDPFMALVHSMTSEDDLEDAFISDDTSNAWDDLGSFSF